MKNKLEQIKKYLLSLERVYVVSRAVRVEILLLQ